MNLPISISINIYIYIYIYIYESSAANSNSIANLRTAENAPRDIFTLNNRVLFSREDSRGRATFAMKFEFTIVAELSSIYMCVCIYIELSFDEKREKCLSTI